MKSLFFRFFPKFSPKKNYSKISPFRQPGFEQKNDPPSSELFLAGYLAWDVLRVEAGHPRFGQDIQAGLSSPIKASLAWTVDQSKLRNHTLFGAERLFRQLARGPAFRLVGLIAYGPAHGGCAIFSAGGAGNRRRPIGVASSAQWSPHLKRRILLGLIKPEYAQNQRPILFNVLLDIPTGQLLEENRRLLSRTDTDSNENTKNSDSGNSSGQTADHSSENSDTTDSVFGKEDSKDNDTKSKRSSDNSSNITKSNVVNRTFAPSDTEALYPRFFRGYKEHIFFLRKTQFFCNIERKNLIDLRMRRFLSINIKRSRREIQKFQ